jgi:hypothetical protein
MRRKLKYSRFLTLKHLSNPLPNTDLTVGSAIAATAGIALGLPDPVSD